MSNKSALVLSALLIFTGAMASCSSDDDADTGTGGTSGVEEGGAKASGGAKAGGATNRGGTGAVAGSSNKGGSAGNGGTQVGSGGTSAGGAGVGGAVAGNGGKGGTASGGTSITAGTAGAGGTKASGGSAGTPQSGGVAGKAGSSGVGGSGATAGTAAAGTSAAGSNNGGTGGVAGNAGNAGTAGTAGAGNELAANCAKICSDRQALTCAIASCNSECIQAATDANDSGLYLAMIACEAASLDSTGYFCSDGAMASTSTAPAPNITDSNSTCGAQICAFTCDEVNVASFLPDTNIASRCNCPLQ